MKWVFFSFFNLLASFELPQPCLPLLQGKDEGCFVGKEIPNEVFVWMIGYTSPKAMCSAYRSGRGVQATRNDLSTQRKQQSGLEGKEITRIKQDGGRCLQFIISFKICPTRAARQCPSVALRLHGLDGFVPVRALNFAFWYDLNVKQHQQQQNLTRVMQCWRY